MPPKTKKTNEITNFYELSKVKEFTTKSINPEYDTHHISVPFRGLLIGSSGSGKTNLLMNIIAIFKKTFNHLYIYTKAQEPLYDFLQSQIPEDMLTISYDLDDCREFDESDYMGQSLVIFDDMVNEKDQKCIQELYIRARKLGCSMLYLTQSYFRVPKIIRQQCQYFWILKVSGQRDLKLILSEYSLGATKDQLVNMYNYCCNSGVFGQFFLIDLEVSQDKTYRKNWDEYLNIKQF